MSVSSEITRIQNGVATQGDLIEDIQDALDGEGTAFVSGVKVAGITLTPDNEGKVNIPAATTNAYGVVKEKQYELIETINITEDTSTITRTQTPSNVAYNFSRLQVEITAPTIDYSSWITIQPHIDGVNIGNFVEAAPAFHETLEGHVQFHIAREYGFITGHALKNIKYNPTTYYGAYGEKLNLYTGNITGFTIAMDEGMHLSNGAVIRIFGIPN